MLDETEREERRMLLTEPILSLLTLRAASFLSSEMSTRFRFLGLASVG